MKRPSLARCWRLLALFSVCTGGASFGEDIPTDITGLLSKLGDDEYRERTQAQEELVHWGMQDIKTRVSFFRNAQLKTEDPEVQARCKEIISELVMILVDEERPGFIGINMAGAFRGFGQKPEPSKGVLVKGVIKDTAAERFGLKEGDLIVRIDDLDLSGVGGADRLKTYVSGKKSGAKIEIQLEREDETLTLPLTLMPFPRVAELSSRRRVPLNSGLPENLTEAEEAELQRMRDLDVENWLRENSLDR